MASILPGESERPRVDVLVEVRGLVVAHRIRLPCPECGQARGDRQARAEADAAMERAIALAHPASATVTSPSTGSVMRELSTPARGLES
jgi:hypothetical protein